MRGRALVTSSRCLPAKRVVLAPPKSRDKSATSLQASACFAAKGDRFFAKQGIAYSVWTGVRPASGTVVAGRRDFGRKSARSREPAPAKRRGLGRSVGQLRAICSDFRNCLEDLGLPGGEGVYLPFVSIDLVPSHKRITSRSHGHLRLSHRLRPSHSKPPNSGADCGLIAGLKGSPSVRRRKVEQMSWEV